MNYKTAKYLFSFSSLTAFPACLLRAGKGLSMPWFEKISTPADLAKML